MSRYLTPSKIGLLALVNVYCESIISSTSTIPLLSFILSSATTPSPEAALLYPKNAQLPMLSATDFDVPALQGELEFPGRTVFHIFVKRLWEIDTLDALHVFFQLLDDLFEALLEDDDSTTEQTNRKIVLSRTSPIGVFVRRAKLEFTRLQFSDVLKLWTAFLHFRQPTLPTLRRLGTRDTSALEAQGRVLQELNMNITVPLAEGEDDARDSGISASDIERMLEFQTDKMQRLGARLPIEMRQRLSELLSSASTVPSLIHFVRFFDAWRAGDYSSSFDNLHRYFDYTLHNRDKTFYQYALLHMAILHADFSCFPEAVAAMNEAIATARENQDLTCLNFSLNWLNHLNKAYPKEMRQAGVSNFLGSERDSLVFLKTKAKEMKMWPLLSSALLSEARLELSQGESVSRVFEHLYQSSHLISNHCIWSSIGGQLLTQSSAYARLGRSCISSSYSDTLILCFEGIAPAEDIARAKQRKAFQKALSGQHDEAIALLNTIQPEQGPETLRISQQRVAWLGLVKLLQQLRRAQYDTAYSLIKQIEAAHMSDPDAKTELAFLTLQYYMQTDQLPAAYDRLHHLSEELELEGADVALRTQLMVLKARIFALSGHAEKGFSLALRAASFAQRAGVMSVLWRAIRELCNILNSLEEFDAVTQLLDAVIPQAHECGDTALLAGLYEVQADAWVGLRMARNDDLKDGTTSINRAAQAGKADVTSMVKKAFLYLDRTENCYKEIGYRPGIQATLAKKAALFELEGNIELANKYATEVVELENSRTMS